MDMPSKRHAASVNLYSISLDSVKFMHRVSRELSAVPRRSVGVSCALLLPWHDRRYLTETTALRDMTTNPDSDLIEPTPVITECFRFLTSTLDLSSHQGACSNRISPCWLSSDEDRINRHSGQTIASWPTQSCSSGGLLLAKHVSMLEKG